MDQNIYADVRARVLQALQAQVPDLPEEVAARVEVTPPREAAHGDMATNAALVAAKAARRKPQEIAAGLVAALQADDLIEAASAAGPGFVNLKLQPEAWRALLPRILAAGESYGDSTAGTAVRINVEYVSANPTGPMHIGHCRGAVVGDALANLLAKVGHPVTKEFYVNDAGGQVTALAWAAYWRYLQALGTPLSEAEFSDEVPGGLQYRGEYLIPVGEALKARFGDSLAAPGARIAAPDLWLATVRDIALGMMLETIRDDLAALGVRHDVFASERKLVESGAADAMIAELRARGLIYEGVLEPPKGKTPEDWEPREQTLFRASDFGDDVDRPLRKSDGSATYFANDIAYHAQKIAAGADVLIDVLGADHGGYLPRMRAAVQAIGGASFEVVLCQIVHVLKGGQPLRMSKRAGTFITLRDLLDEVGPDAVRFTMLTRKADAQFEFDIDTAVAQTRENPVFYVQYAHARCRSVLRAATEMLGEAAIAPDRLAEAALDSLGADAELALIRRLGGWPRLVESAAQAREPHRIAFFLYDLAADFHMLWNRGRDDAALRFLQPDRPAETLARLALVAATAITIRSGLAVMGVAPVEEMR
ncbi:Arginine--tRNA ligase [Rhodovastum atsumiense]|uniref:Arginine--tRNA ligase n=1 Tax=Rhodovastum atsumiense TaxID=504468 RepID=A0A5M6IJG9_9PROT|nr:arginine--tRNA ligase [Rhodovastum atsumiense]KAA5608312.1 arginine--tRNA ligase [Rhodovastum atsumiense]CAH2605065.1 Arginine--tRNA ligase [Rhodovastum atsumiense]